MQMAFVELLIVHTVSLEVIQPKVNENIASLYRKSFANDLVGLELGKNNIISSRILFACFDKMRVFVAKYVVFIVYFIICLVSIFYSTFSYSYKYLIPCV